MTSRWRSSRSTAGVPLSIGRARWVSQRIPARWRISGARSMRTAMKCLQPPARLVEQHVFGMAAEQFLAQDSEGFDRWLHRGDTPAARLLAGIRRARPSFGVSEVALMPCSPRDALLRDVGAAVGARRELRPRATVERSTGRDRCAGSPLPGHARALTWSSDSVAPRSHASWRGCVSLQRCLIGCDDAGPWRHRARAGPRSRLGRKRARPTRPLRRVGR